MRLLNQHNIWPIARLNNYKLGILITATILILSILGFLYLNGGNINVTSKVIVAISQNDSDKNVNNIIQILKSNKINNGYKIISEAEISELFVGLNNTASISKYLTNKDNYTFPVFIEFDYKVYYQFNIESLIKGLNFNKYIIDNSLSLINVFIYVVYFIFLLLALSLCNIYFLKLDKKSIQIMNYYGANTNLLMRLLYRRILFNTLIGFVLGWLVIFTFSNILNLKNVISLNTIYFISLKSSDSIFYFLFLLIIVLYTQYIVTLKVLKKYMRIKSE